MAKPQLALRRSDFESPDQFAPALERLSAGDLDAGFKLLTAAHERYPNDPRGANFLGTFYFNADRIEEACAYFARAASLAAGVSAYAYNEASALMMAGRPEAAWAAYLRSLYGDELLLDAHRWAWGALARCGFEAAAIRSLREALRADLAQHQSEPVSDRVDLGGVTLCAVDCMDPDLAARSLRRSMTQCQFGAIKLFTSLPATYEGVETVSIPAIASFDEYSRFMMKELFEYIDTDFALVTQWDGYVINASAWTDEFLVYDYIGSTWDEDLIRSTGCDPAHTVGNGGFSLRSRTLLQAGSDPALVLTDAEDARLCMTYRSYLEQHHWIRYADASVANRFSFEANRCDSVPFGFHGSFNMCAFERDPRWARFEFLGPNRPGP
jgi:tetratricopeptide (TPR) repeat protein